MGLKGAVLLTAGAAVVSLVAVTSVHSMTSSTLSVASAQPLAATRSATTQPAVSPVTTISPRGGVTEGQAVRPAEVTAAKSTTAKTAATTSKPAPKKFKMRGVKAKLPSGAQCATWVRSVAKPKEIKGVNKKPNATKGKKMKGATGLNKRVDGAFTGSTEQVLRWTACKWGIDENVVKAQAAVESWWRMDTKGDLGTDSSRCAPGHGLGRDGHPGQCPESFGLLQVRYPYNQAAFPYAATSSAFNADYAYAQWRNCYLGKLTWLNTVEKGKTYAKGDYWGCLGVWFSGRWHTAAAEDYITKVKGYLKQAIWKTRDFKQP